VNVTQSQYFITNRRRRSIAHANKGVGRKISRGPMEKTRPKNTPIKPLSTLSVSCMKIRGGGHGPLCRRSCMKMQHYGDDN